MRTLFFLFISIILLNCTFGQHNERLSLDVIKKHEFKVNAFNLLTAQSADVAYEYIINENTSLGCNVFFRLYRDEVKESSFIKFELDNSRSFSLTPYFRRYFSKGYANGFFIEGFGMLSSGKKVEIEYFYIGQPESEDFTRNEVKIFDAYTDFAFGLSFGGKKTFENGVFIEYYTGMGLNIKNEYTITVSRGGFSIGYRF